MSIGNTGGGVRPVRIDFEAKDGVSPPLKQMEEMSDRVRQAFRRNFAEASLAIEKTEKSTVAASAAVTKSVEQWQASIRKIREQYEGLEVVSKKTGNSMQRDLTNALQSAQQSLAQISAGIREFGERSSQLTTVGTAFRNLSRDAGLSSDELLASLKKSTRGQVDELELMKNANMASFLSGKEILAQLPQLLEIAVASSKATGQNVEFLTQSLVTGIGRLSPRIIDNLGLTVKLEEVNVAYAKAIGKTVEALTAQEQRQALVNEVLRQGKDLIASTGGQVTTLGGKMKETEVFITNVKDSLLSMSSEGMTSMGPFIGTVGAVSGKLSDLSGTLLAVNSIWQIGGTAAVGWVGIATVAVGGVVTAAKELSEKLVDVPRLLDEIGRASGTNLDGLKERLKAASDAFTFGRVAEGIPIVGSLLSAYRELSPAVDRLGAFATNAANALHALNNVMERGAQLGSKTSFLSDLLGGIGKSVGDVGKTLNKGGIVDLLGERLKAREEVQRMEDTARKKEQQAQAKEQREFEKAQKEIARIQREAQKERDKARKELLQGELADAKDRAARLETMISESETLYKRGTDAVVDWSHSTRDAMAEYRAALQETIDAQTAGAGLFDFSLSSFSLLKFGAKARAKEAVGPAPTQSGFVKGTFDIFAGQGLVGPETSSPVRQAIIEYEQLQRTIQNLESALQLQPKSIDALSDAYARANARTAEASALTGESIEQLADRVTAIDSTLRPLSRATDELSLASTGLQDISGAISRIVISSEGTAEALQRLKTALDSISAASISAFVTAMTNAKNALDSFAAKADTERLGRLKAFRDMFNAATNSFTWAIGQFNATLNPGGTAQAAVGSFSSFLGSTAGGANFLAFRDWFTATGGVINGSLQTPLANLQANIALFNTGLGTLAVTPATNFNAFKNYFSAVLPGSVNTAKLLFQAGSGGLRDTITQFGIYLGAQIQSVDFVNFFTWFDSTLPLAITNAKNALSNSTTGLPSAMNALKGEMANFNSDTRVTGMVAIMNTLKDAAVTMAGAFSGMVGATGSLSVAAAKMGTLRDAAVPTRDAFVSLGTPGSGAIATTSAALTSFSTGGVTSATTALNTLKTSANAVGTANSGALYDLGTGITNLTQKMVPASSANTLTYALTQLANANTSSGSMDLMRIASESWKTSTATLKDDVATLAQSVIGLNSALLSLRSSRSAQDKISIPDSRTQGYPQGTGQGTATWEFMYELMNPNNSYKTRNILRDTVLPSFGGDWVDAAIDLEIWWNAFGLQNRRGRSSAPGLTPQGGSPAGRRGSAGGAPGVGSAGGSSISLNITINNPVMTNRRAVDDLARQITKRVGRSLRATPAIGRLTAGA